MMALFDDGAFGVPHHALLFEETSQHEADPEILTFPDHPKYFLQEAEFRAIAKQEYRRLREKALLCPGRIMFFWAMAPAGFIFIEKTMRMQNPTFSDELRVLAMWVFISS